MRDIERKEGGVMQKTLCNKGVVLLMLGAFSSLLPSLCYADARDVLIKTDSLEITQKMLLDEINSNSEERKEYLLTHPSQLTEYIDIFYREKLFEQLAVEQKVDQTSEFKALIKSSNRRLLVNKFVEDKKKAIKIPDLEASAKEFYIVNTQQFKIGVQVDARHILLKAKPDDKNREATRLRLGDILAKIKKDPEQFEVLAKEHSEDSGSAVNGGRLGRFSKGRMVSEFEEEAFKLTKSGQLSEVFGTQYGFHIIQLITAYPTRIASFDEVKGQIISKLQEEYVEDEYMRWRKEVAGPEKAQVDEEKLQGFIKSLLKK